MSIKQINLHEIPTHFEFSTNSAAFLLVHYSCLVLNKDFFSLGSLLGGRSGPTLPTHSNIHLDARGRHQSLHQTG